MLELVTRHGGFDLTLQAKGDLDVDQHHTVEDVGIALGEAVSQALGTRRGINRAGYFVMPMDETLAVAAIDLGGPRPRGRRPPARASQRVGDLQAELVSDFFEGFAQGARANVHVKVLYGRSSHHQIEAVFKAFARALRVRLLAGTGSWRRRCRARKGCCRSRGDIALIDYGAGNLTSVRKGFAAAGAELRHASDAGGPPAGDARSSCRASATSQATAPLDEAGDRRSSARSIAAFRCSASVSDCSGSSRAATRPHDVARARP